MRACNPAPARPGIPDCPIRGPRTVGRGDQLQWVSNPGLTSSGHFRPWHVTLRYSQSLKAIGVKHEMQRKTCARTGTDSSVQALHPPGTAAENSGKLCLQPGGGMDHGAGAVTYRCRIAIARSVPTNRALACLVFFFLPPRSLASAFSARANALRGGRGCRCSFFGFFFIFYNFLRFFVSVLLSVFFLSWQSMDKFVCHVRPFDRGGGCKCMYLHLFASHVLQYQM